MVARAVSARDWLTPLALLVPIGGTPLLALWALSIDPFATGPVFAVLVIAAGLAAIVTAGRHFYGAAYALGTAAFTWVTVVIAFPFWYAAIINGSVCGKDVAAAWEWLPPTGAALAFLALGSFGLRTGRGLMLVPLASLLGLIVEYVLLAAVPGTQGFCD